jgi:hypothetical protein
MRSLPESFLIAFSFAGEQRELVRSIAEAVESRLGHGSVFFDEWFEHWLAGDDADLKLQDLYANRCTLAVVCVSGRYGGKPWTQAEHRAIRARNMRAGEAERSLERFAILPIRVGDGDVPGILFNTIVPDVRQRSPEATSELIVARLGVLSPGLELRPADPARRRSPAQAARQATQRQALVRLGRQYEAALMQSVNAVDAVTRVQAECQADDIEHRMREIEKKIETGG